MRACVWVVEELQLLERKKRGYVWRIFGCSVEDLAQIVEHVPLPELSEVFERSTGLRNVWLTGKSGELQRTSTSIKSGVQDISETHTT